MKITLTQFEAAEMLRQNFQQNVHPNVDVKTLDIVIDQPLRPIEPTGRRDIRLMDLVDVVRTVAQGQSSQKIAAIKALREAAANQGVNIGLGDAKLFVELLLY